MNRTGWGVAILVSVMTTTVMAEEPTTPGVARLSPLPIPAEVDTDRQPFVNLDVRLIELHGKVRLPLTSRKEANRRGNVRGLLTADQLATVRESWKSDPDAKIVTAARLRIKLGAKGEYRKGREIPVVEQAPSGKGESKPAPVIRKEFCGTSIDATFTAVDAESIAVQMLFAHTTQEGRDPVSGTTLSAALSLEEGKTFLLPLGKNEHITRKSRFPFAREELTEHGLIVLITPTLEAGSTE